MKVVALASYPIEAAATRYRLAQFVLPLEKHDIAMTIHPFLDAQTFEQLYRRASWPRTAAGLLKSSMRRLNDLFKAAAADVILVQREAMMFGPPVFEWLTTRALRRPMVLDLDDATYVPYTSPTYGAFSKTLKWFSKTDDLIKWASIVVCGNRSIAEYVSGKGGRAKIIPTVVDTKLFRPVERATKADSPIVIGWVGTHSTFPYLQTVFPVLQQLAERHRIRLKIVGAGKNEVKLPGVQVDNLPWKLQREIEDFESLDIGLYPIDEGRYAGWASGKSGFKAIQYMATGIPFVATPVGGSREIGEAGSTHLFATTADEWYRSLEKLIVDADLRRALGAAGREHVTKHYALEDQADKLANVLREAASN